MPEKSPPSEPNPEGKESGDDADGEPIPGSDDGATSAPGEGEGATGPGEGEGQGQDDPLAGLTFEQVQERFKDDLEQLGKQRWEEGRRKGQGDSDTAHEKRMQEQMADAEAIRVFEDLSAKARSQNPDERDQFTQAMQDDRTASLYERGRKASRGPDVGHMIGQATSNVITEVIDILKNEPEMKTLTAEERALLDVNRMGEDGKPIYKTLGQLFAEQMKVFRAKVKAAAKESVKQSEIDAAVKTATEELLNKLGLEPSSVEGRAESSSVNKIRDDYAEGRIDTPTYKKRMEAAGAEP